MRGMRRFLVVLGAVGALVLAGLSLPAQAGPSTGLGKWALLVGIDHFQGKTRPNTGSVGDVEDVREALLRKGWASDHIRVLTDGAATAKGIREGLAWLAANSNDRTYSVFHYSGHVKQVGSTVYLWPHDNQHIRDTELADALNRVQGWAWFNIAGCEAAAFDKGLSSPRHLVTMSSQANEKSYEMPKGVRNSVFTYFLIDQAVLAGDADGNGDGRVSLQEAFAYASSHAPAMTEDQRHGPQHPQLAGGDGSEWFLDPPPPPPPPPPPAKAPTGRCLILCK